jgi:hypothetical protein
VRFSVDIAEPRGAWEPVARLDIGGQLSDGSAEDLRFNPAHSGGGISPIGLLQAVRRLSYGASQVGRAGLQG